VSGRHGVHQLNMRTVAAGGILSCRLGRFSSIRPGGRLLSMRARVTSCAGGPHFLIIISRDLGSIGCRLSSSSLKTSTPFLEGEPSLSCVDTALGRSGDFVGLAGPSLALPRCPPALAAALAASFPARRVATTAVPALLSVGEPSCLPSLVGLVSLAIWDNALCVGKALSFVGGALSFMGEAFSFASEALSFAGEALSFMGEALSKRGSFARCESLSRDDLAPRYDGFGFRFDSSTSPSRAVGLCVCVPSPGESWRSGRRILALPVVGGGLLGIGGRIDSPLQG
jgi:hypothetical protein